MLEARPGLADRLNNYLYGASHRLYGARAGMIDALILGRRGGIDPELQDRFARSGPGPPALDLGLPRRAHHRLGVPVRPARRDSAGPTR